MVGLFTMILVLVLLGGMHLLIDPESPLRRGERTAGNAAQRDAGASRQAGAGHDADVEPPLRRAA
ncbi:hypothetical protein [Sediminicurvatus halobius]|uniref:Uncharacterized protein n=1 Tax=Sediminicurvatus halobius TaxID=2182432 RepID=A0A2U2N746_9GAMM|nr:hypothetical protein [Spiribacter halobius]PWG64960.1 hypothetical protein DEM34_03970 [Spiribacter halobius]UEX78183.1 hypothetical protein LMH63_00640 [Spiribacter halobius]